MRDTNFGSLSGRQLTLRWIVPWSFQRWNGYQFAFTPWRLLNPLCWVRAIVKGDYDLWWRLHRDCNHRCYCPVGVSFDGSIKAAGWGVIWFYSHYTGEVPCWCDKAIAAEFGGEEEEEAHA